ncbi:hypothetical protein EDC19_2767 [Natranaerovirga hydrolytica]|uniref:Ada DNA repair metal-binding domain-containing protein n=1 Tax=Natranaerovirga hydrolytica TaxID=680378 RepID=A0A4R1MDJ6_9FIRM|nr:hypothetical protein [Natranaerovirga hydrolytica]TCK87923.1 hypothetical protein EDC19_2767 [Natranaerovirga hydrolytica]
MVKIKYGLIFTLIIIPFFFIGFRKDTINDETIHMKHRYNRYLKTAIQDASASLLLYATYDRTKDNNNVNIDTTDAINTFFDSLYLQMGYDISGVSTDYHYGLAEIKKYVPVILIMDYDGYYIYGMERYEDEKGYHYTNHQLLPKRYYTYRDEEDQVLQFFLDDYVQIHNVETGEIIEGLYDEIKEHSDLLQKENFQIIKKETIIKSIEDSLNVYINQHNEYGKGYGFLYDFYLPSIKDEEWDQLLEDIGIMAFLQGIPIFNDQYVNIYGIQGSKILSRTEYIGYVKEGVPFYGKEGCQIYKDYTVTAHFDNRKEAASRGYYPCPECNP